MRRIYILLIILFFSVRASSQDISIKSLLLSFDGNNLTVSYDLNSLKASDRFYVWLEISKMNGDTLVIKTVTGDYGAKVHSGTNKKMYWNPARDSVFLNEDIQVEVKAEKYNKLYNKGSAILLSTIMPGLGQTKINNGKPWWITGVSAYGLVGAGLLIHSSSSKNYNSYTVEADPAKRTEYFDKAQRQRNTSGTMLISGTAIWAVNLIWITIAPNKYEPLKHMGFYFDRSPGQSRPTPYIGMKINF